MRSHVELWAGENTHRAVLDLEDHTGAAVTNATVTIKLLERDGTTEVAGTTWPITMSHTGSGRYIGTIPAGAALEHGKLYTVNMLAVRGAEKAHWRETGVRASNRGL